MSAAGTEGAAKELPFRRPSRETLHDRIYASLREALVAGKFMPGQVLSNRAIAEAMGSSPIPVREALRRLISERGLVVLRNGSVAVPEFSAAEFEDLRNVRCMVEGEAAERGAGRMSAAAVNHLERACGTMEKAFAKGDRELYLLANKKFHFAIYSQCGSPLLISIIDSLWLQLGPFLNLSVAPEAFDFGIAHQRAVVAAIRAGNTRAARESVLRDIMESAAYILANARRGGTRGEKQPTARSPSGRIRIR